MSWTAVDERDLWALTADRCCPASRYWKPDNPLRYEAQNYRYSKPPDIDFTPDTRINRHTILNKVVSRNEIALGSRPAPISFAHNSEWRPMADHRRPLKNRFDRVRGNLCTSPHVRATLSQASVVLVTLAGGAELGHPHCMPLVVRL